MFRSIVVAVDSSSTRHCATRTAGEVARMTGAKVHIVHVAESAIAWDTVVRIEEDTEADEILEEALSNLRDMGVEATGEVFPANARQVPGVISRAADEAGADLIVLGPHHRGSVAAFFSPRVSDAVSHASRIAVLLAPEGGRDPS
ncbi:universal stress protein [Streptomyces sp. NPDC001276]|uniref:universal stress protein n=1 Tax=Streptomyces sp. NPDC001276 TaxID=3364555 RepID=UPI00368743BD